MTAEEFNRFCEKYEGAKKSLGYAISITDADREIVADVLAGMPLKEVVKKHGKSEVYINKRVVMVLQEKNG